MKRFCQLRESPVAFAVTDALVTVSFTMVSETAILCVPSGARYDPVAVYVPSAYVVDDVGVVCGVVAPLVAVLVVPESVDPEWVVSCPAEVPEVEGTVVDTPGVVVVPVDAGNGSVAPSSRSVLNAMTPTIATGMIAAQIIPTRFKNAFIEKSSGLFSRSITQWSMIHVYKRPVMQR
jgi:hypothetical protein